MHIRRTHSALVLFLILTLAFACGKQKEAPQNADPSTDNEETPSEVTSADTSGTDQKQQNHDSTEQKHQTSESEQEATFKVGGMVTRFGMV